MPERIVRWLSRVFAPRPGRPAIKTVVAVCSRCGGSKLVYRGPIEDFDAAAAILDDRDHVVCYECRDGGKIA